MGFRIDLKSKEDVFIYLVVINDVINVNFETADPANKHLAAQVRERFNHLLSEHASLEHLQNMVRGEDAEHIKRHHVVVEETHTPHFHYSFDQEVTPELLKHFFEQLLIAQKSAGHANDQFVTEEEVNTLLKAFGIFYTGFKDSQLEKEFLNERKLTKEEKNSLVQHAKQEKTSHLSKKDVSELTECGFSSSEIPKPTEQPEQDSLNLPFNISSMEEMLLTIRLIGLLTQTSGVRPDLFQSQQQAGPMEAGRQNNTTSFMGLRPGFFQSQQRPASVETPRQGNSSGIFGFKPGFLFNKPEVQRKDEHEPSQTKSFHQ
ncbi:hypothetical protein [Legionella sp. WA2024007413]